MTEPNGDTRLTCPRHPGEKIIYLVEDQDDDSLVVCENRPECDYVFQNILKYPVVELHVKGSDGTVLRNMLTGDYVDAETAVRLNSGEPG